jgi:hypothetical protein
VSALPRRESRPGFAESVRLDEKRAQGMPGAGCTHSLVCKNGGNNAHKSSQVRRNAPAFPARWFIGCSVISPVSRAC